MFDKSDGKFLVTGPFDSEMPSHYIIIRDYRWWVDNEKEIYRWMEDCLPNGKKHHQGMVVVIDDESDASNFLLRWQ